MTNKIIQNINKYKTKSSKHLINQQTAYIPMLEDDQIECTVQSYLVDGKRTIINQSTQICFRLKYIKFRPMSPRKNLKYKNGIWSFKHLVQEKVIYPLMIFINGYFIPWKFIDIALGQENYYLLISTEKDTYPYNLVRDIEYAQIVTLPQYITYHEYDTPTTVDSDTVFYFNSVGEFSFDNAIYTFMREAKGNHIDFHYWTSLEGINAFKIYDDTSIKLTEKNIILFSGSRFATGERKNIVRSFDGNYTNEETKVVTPCLEFVTSDKDIGKNPTLEVDGTLLTIGDGTNPNNEDYKFALFINYKHTKTADNINLANPDSLSTVAQKKNAGEIVQYFYDMQIPFEMEMDRSKKYNTNVSEAIATMFKYNASLFNSVMKENSNLIIDEYSGEFIVAYTDEVGIFNLPRQHSNHSTEYIIMLVNGEIYKYHRMIKYYANKCCIPIQGIHANDRIEFLRFINVNNDVFDITVNKDDGFMHYSEDIINDNMILFSTETDDEYFTYPEEGFQHFPVEYSLETDENGYIKINLSNEFYYGKSLKIAYNNRFIHHEYVLNSDNYNEFKVKLSDKFMYCYDYSKYMIFINGRRINSDHYRLVLPVKSTTPFYEFVAYFTIPLSEGDRVDIYYVPSLMKDIIMIPEIPMSGDIVIDKDIIDYPLSTDLYMIWVNGKKVAKSYISDIDSTHIRLTTDEESIKNVFITKYIPGIDVLTDAFHNNEALWDIITLQLTDGEVSNILGINAEVLTNTEEDVYANILPIKSVMYELIRDQYVSNTRVDTTSKFVYDYIDIDDTVIDHTDKDGNKIILAMDSNVKDNLDSVDRNMP